MFHKKQHGAALLVFMLLLIIASSYYLVTEVNSNIRRSLVDRKTLATLNHAKQALIGYAVSFPETDAESPGDVIDGPGYLPCPDTNNDGSALGNCSSGGNTMIGRFPFRTLEMSELRDSSGQRLWYVLSENFRNNNKLIPLNSESPGSAELVLDGTSDIVALIIAPMEPVGDQARDPAETSVINDIAEYLEDDNNNYFGAPPDQSFVSTAAGNFNDVVIAITRQELMRAVEKRVLNDISKVLINYFNFIDTDDDGNAAYPWLTSYADPKTAVKNLTGTHTRATSSSTTLNDATKDFINDWNVSAGDIIRNITDGSEGVITAVATTTLTTAGLTSGIENEFDQNDEYIVYLNYLSTADGVTAGLTLEDTDRDFEEMGIVAGDIVDNLDDGSSGVIASVSGSQITASSLTGGDNDDFEVGDEYIIRSNTGQATAGSFGFSLEDSNKDFIVMGIQVDDLVINLTDGSYGLVSSVVDANNLTVSELYHGIENDFDQDDRYYFPRFNTNNLTRQGLLSVHETGKHFKTAFTLDWSITAANGATVTLNTAGTEPVYDAVLQTYVEGSFGTVNIAISNGICSWSAEDNANCLASFTDNILDGNVTAGVNSVTLTDNTVNFITSGIKAGDIVLNFDDEETTIVTENADVGSGNQLLIDADTNFNALNIVPYQYLVINNTAGNRAIVSEVVNDNTLRFEAFDGGAPINFNTGDQYTIWAPQKMVVNTVTDATNLLITQLSGNNPDFDVAFNEYYRIQTATELFDGVVDGAAPSATILEDTTADFTAANIQVGDIVENETDGSFGLVIAAPTATQITVAALYDGTDNQFEAGDNYKIHFSYADRRKTEYRINLTGDSNIYIANNQRERDVCLGYDADCSLTPAAANDVALPENTTPVVSVYDYDLNSNQVGGASVTIDSTTDGSIRVSGLDFYLYEADTELPEWFITNNWHKLIHVVISDGDTASTAAVCTDTVNCLFLSQGGVTINNQNKRAIVIMAGESLAAQDRSTGNLDGYFENDNNNSDDVLQRDQYSGNYNDQMRILDTVP